MCGQFIYIYIFACADFILASLQSEPHCFSALGIVIVVVVVVVEGIIGQRFGRGSREELLQQERDRKRERILSSFALPSPN